MVIFNLLILSMTPHMGKMRHIKHTKYCMAINNRTMKRPVIIINRNLQLDQIELVQCSFYAVETDYLSTDNRDIAIY